MGQREAEGRLAPGGAFNSVWDSLQQQLDYARPSLGLGINGGCDHSCRTSVTRSQSSQLHNEL